MKIVSCTILINKKKKKLNKYEYLSAQLILTIKIQYYF